MTELVYATPGIRYEHQNYTHSSTLFTTGGGTAAGNITLYFHTSPSGDVRLNSVPFPIVFPTNTPADRIRTTTPIPESLRPGTTVYGTICYADAVAVETEATGLVSIDVNGVLRFHAGVLTATTFTNAGAGNFLAISFNYQRRNPF